MENLRMRLTYFDKLTNKENLFEILLICSEQSLMENIVPICIMCIDGFRGLEIEITAGCFG